MSRENLIKECHRQFDNCNYTAVSMFIWLREKRRMKGWFIVLPIIFGGIATMELVAKSDNAKWRVIAAVCAALAGLLPSIYAALKFDDDLERLKSNASEYNNLKDRFRQCANLYSDKPYEHFEAQFMKLMDRMDKARSESLTAPERHFESAQKKIATGDYSFDVDLKPVATTELAHATVSELSPDATPSKSKPELQS